MGFEEMFLLNLGMLITVAYLANVIYKYFLTKMSSRTNYLLSVALIIFAGWICIKFGFQLNDNVIFDLRFVPLIIATVVYTQPLTLIFIGFGIGLARLSFGINDASIAGFINLMILGVFCAGLNVWLRRSNYRFVIKGIIVILAVNVLYTLNIAVFGVIPFKEYMLDIMPTVLSLSILLSAVFALILRDFQLDQRRTLDLKYANELLRNQADELHKAKIVLEERAKQLSLSSRYKSEFLANMSHELRTPLNSIINLAQIISENDGEENEVAEHGQIIYRSGQDLLQLINDILDLSKVEAGRLEIMHEEVNLAEIPQMLHMHFEHVAIQKEIQFDIINEEGLPDIIISDAQRIGQILRNLLSNAFKFTHEGQVKLEIRRATEGNEILFIVSDTGIGIPEDKYNVIFEAFHQADGSINRKYGGTGLGLPISRDLARLLGGYIAMESKVGIGSTFTLHLPLS
ncbi:ATP-binding protein [Paenibacillus segetis]|uniref:histidine kinase n=1 Tax=Paenibacillus segetis TaxID=1325360 RepID=A0ABQ1YVW1_9BACL|nr:ATP-binding protein [Paenibacillus segetis]GGH38003.1 hypothetical protein GCM10008013_45800 [Paenibacillus segetis]